MVRIGRESQRKESLGAGPPHAMASVVVKTIWQSKEIHEAGDPPAGVENHSQMIAEAPGGVTNPAKGISKKKKAVSFHGWVPCTLSAMVPAPNTASHTARVSMWVLVKRRGTGGAGKEEARGRGGIKGRRKAGRCGSVMSTDP